MPYGFSHGESFQDALIRIGVEQFDRARKTLKHDAPDAAIHETRKCIKRLRALLRLVRSGIGDATFDAENGRLRDIARSLSGARDRTVLLATITRLAGLHPKVKELQKTLQADVLQTSSEGPAHSSSKTQETALSDLAEARSAWKGLELASDSFAPIAEGLACGLRDLDDASSRADESGDDEAAHDWRKAAQRHWRHMRLLEAGWPGYFQSRAAEARAVSDLLGDAQDLALFVRWIESLSADQLDRDDARAIIDLARREQKAHRMHAMLRTDRLTGERPQAHARRAEKFWNAAARLPLPQSARNDPKKVSARKQAEHSKPAKRASGRIASKSPTRSRK